MDQNLPEGQASQPTNIRAIFIVILAIGILAAAVAYAVNRGGGGGDSQNQTAEEEFEFEAIAPQTIVYGTWNGDSALIKSYDLQTGEQDLVVELEDQVKKITILDQDKTLYIYDTNERDHGSQIAVYSVEEGVPYPVYNAEPGGFGIDDYVISPDKKWIAVWEVRFAEGSEQLIGGESRIYAARIDGEGTSQKYPIFNETQEGNNPIHYPVAITNDGRVFADTFLPNLTERGWGYGVTVANFDGSDKQEIADMANGRVGSFPRLSPDGQSILFTSYSTPRNSTNPDTRADDLAGANVVAIYNLQSNSVERLNLPTNQTYIDAKWDNNGDVIYWSLAGPSVADTSGMYRYDRSSNESTLLELDDPSAEWVITTLENGILLVGAEDASFEGVLGNLSERYAPPFTGLYILDNNGEWWDLEVEANSIQYIGLLPGSYFAEEGETSIQAKKKNKNKKQNKNNNQGGDDSGGEGDEASEAGFGSECTGFDNLQLCPFYFKAQLQPKREAQQTIPACYDGLIGPECERRGYDKNSKNREEVEKYRECLRKLVRPYRQAGYCVGSPLYLYGAEGTKVHVTIGTNVYNAVPTYKNGYDVVLGKDGEMAINGGTFDSITYDFTQALRKPTIPNKGYVVAKKDVEKTLRSYAGKLGLNEKETNDLVEYGLEQVVSPYVYISHFDQKTSERILPITFSPEPDNYLNVVFYFRLLSDVPPFTVQPPVFPEPLTRDGFTAVEVSAIVQ